jgi:hypothetical protein
MAKQILNRGAQANDGTGDNLREGADKINSNFSEIYGVLGNGDNLLTTDIDFGENKILFSNTVATQSELAGLDASKYVGMIIHAQNTGSLYYAHSGTWRKLLTDNSAGNVPQYVDSLKNVAYSGNYNDLTNRPLIPTRLTDIGIIDGSAGQSLTTDGTGNFVFRDIEATSVSFNNIIDKPTTIAGYGINDAFTGRYEDLLNKPALFSGNYNDLSNKPVIPLDIDDLTDNSNLLFDGQYINLSGKPSIPTDVNQLSDASNLFFSRSYNDLTNKPNFFNNLVELSLALGVTVDEFSNDINMTDNSATALVTERAVKTYIANQIALIPIPDQIGNFTLGNSTIDTDDSSAITITPAIIASSDLSVENNLIVRNSLIVDNNITVAGVITASSFVSTGSGSPEFISETDITLSAADRVTISSSPLKMASFTSVERDTIVAQNGDVIYNTTTNKFQGYANNTWVDLH